MFGGMRQSFGTTEVLVRGLTIDMSGGPKPTSSLRNVRSTEGLDVVAVRSRRIG